MKQFIPTRRLTPTQIANDTFVVSRARKVWPEVKGPSGIMIPDPRSPYLAKTDGPVLTRIERAAFEAWARVQTPIEWEDRITAALLADVRGRFPCADMAVLKRYGFTIETRKLYVEMGARYPARSFCLAEPIDIPQPATRFTTTDSDRTAHVPEEHLPFFDTIAEVEDARRAISVNGATGWVSRFKGTSGVYPTWGAIGEEFPRIGAWMEKQREGAARD